MEESASFIKSFLSNAWALFSVPVPGFNFTFGQMLLSLSVINLSIVFMHIVFGFGSGKGTSYRTGSAKNPKISKERENDEK